MIHIIHSLQLIVNERADHDDTDANIAWHLLHNIYNDDFRLNINDVADACFTSTSTVSRFVRRLGFDNFNDMKKNYEMITISKDELFFDNLENMHFDFRNDREILRRYVDIVKNSLDDMLDHFDFAELDQLCKDILEAGHIYLFGLQIPAQLMSHTQFLMLYLGINVQFYPNQNEQIKVSKMVEKGALAIVASVDGNYLREMKEVVFNLVERDAKRILITQNPSLKLANRFDQIIYLGDYQYAKNGRYKLHVYFEILINRLYLLSEKRKTL